MWIDTSHKHIPLKTMTTWLKSTISDAICIRNAASPLRSKDDFLSDSDTIKASNCKVSHVTGSDAGLTPPKLRAERNLNEIARCESFEFLSESNQSMHKILNAITIADSFNPSSLPLLFLLVFINRNPKQRKSSASKMADEPKSKFIVEVVRD